MDAFSQFRLQRRVGLVLVGASLFSAVLNVITLVYAHHDGFADTIKNPFVSILVVLAILSLPTTLIDRGFVRAFQVTVFLSLGLSLVVVNRPGNLGGIAFFVFGLVLALRFGYFERRTRLKFAFVAVLAISAALGSILRHHGASFGYAIGLAGISGSFLYLYWAAFTDEIGGHRMETGWIEQEAISNQIFVKLGRNVAGVIHNVRSKLMSIEGFNELIADETMLRKSTAGYVAYQRHGIEQLREMMDGLLLAVRSYRHSDGEEVMSLSKIVRSAVEMLRANRTVRSGIEINLDLCADDEIQGVPLTVIQILDGLIQNAWESMLTVAEQIIEIETQIDGPFVVCRVRDHGIGLPFCTPCRNEDCLRCPVFRMGRSTKPDGSGVGVIHIRDLILEMGGKLKYTSSSGGGTTVSVWFPRPRAADPMR